MRLPMKSETKFTAPFNVGDEYYFRLSDLEVWFDGIQFLKIGLKEIDDRNPEDYVIRDAGTDIVLATDAIQAASVICTDLHKELQRVCGIDVGDTRKEKFAKWYDEVYINNEDRGVFWFFSICVVVIVILMPLCYMESEANKKAKAEYFNYCTQDGDTRKMQGGAPSESEEQTTYIIRDFKELSFKEACGV